MTDIERAEETRLKLESMHRQVLLNYADEIRRECDASVQDTLTVCGIHLDAGIRKAISAAILGTEPAREEL